MGERNPIFDTHYQDYLTRVAAIDIADISDKLGLRPGIEDRFHLPFFTDMFLVSNRGSIKHMNGDHPSYPQLVIMARYLLNCPEVPHESKEWVSFKDFKLISHFTNVNYFRSDTEAAIVKSFTGQLDRLKQAGLAFGGEPATVDFPYDLALQFEALPKISLLLLFNEQDEDFPATSTVLFQKHAEWYLDPEALAMTSAYLASRLSNLL